MSSYNTVFKVYKYGVMCHRCERPFFSPSLDCRVSYAYDDILRSVSSSSVSRRMLRSLMGDMSLKHANDLLVKIGENNMMFNRLKDTVSTVAVKKDKVVDELPSADSCRKAKRRLADIILNNEWNCFITLTIDPSCADRYSPQVAIDILNKFCHNYFRRQKGHYIFVPEKHADGAFHFHGLALLPYLTVDYGIVRANNGYGKELDTYNLLAWQYGNSVLEVISPADIYSKLHYVTDYISPNNKKVLPHWYYSGGFLIRKPVLIYSNTDDFFLDTIVENGAKEWKPVTDDKSLQVLMFSYWYDDVAVVDDLMKNADIYYDPYHSVTVSDVLKNDPLKSLYPKKKNIG